MLTALILSAGSSSRMGQPKALLKFSSGKTLLQDQCERINLGVTHYAPTPPKDQHECIRRGVLTYAHTEIHVVVGCDADNIINAHKHLNVNWVINKNWEQGSFLSLQCGVREIVQTHGLGPVLVLPVDVVGVEPKIIQQIIDRGISLSANIIPAYQGQKGHPVFLCTETVQDIMAQSFKDGRLDCILKESTFTKTIEVSSTSILNNVNTWEEWGQRNCS